jgi:hypothetical protein
MTLLLRVKGGMVDRHGESGGGGATGDGKICMGLIEEVVRP